MAEAGQRVGRGTYACRWVMSIDWLSVPAVAMEMDVGSGSGNGSGINTMDGRLQGSQVLVRIHTHTDSLAGSLLTLWRTNGDNKWVKMTSAKRKWNDRRTEGPKDRGTKSVINTPPVKSERYAAARQKPGYDALTEILTHTQALGVCCVWKSHEIWYDACASVGVKSKGRGGVRTTQDRPKQFPFNISSCLFACLSLHGREK